MDELMNVREAADYLRLNSIEVYALAQKHRIPAFKVGENWRFKRDILDKWLNRQAKPNIGSVLIVDDDPMILEILKEIIQDQHHAVTMAESGEEALNEIDKQHFDLIFLDLLLPGIQGPELLDEVKEKDKNAVVVVITAFADEPVALKTMQRGPLLLMRKPFREKDIIEILNVIIKPRAQQAR